jgi:hypothetical protein
MSAAGGARREPAHLSGEENLYVVAYDIASPRRWRKVFRTMEAYGEWLQLSVFQCRLTRRRQIELKLALGEIINPPRITWSSSISGRRRRSGRASKAWASRFRSSIAGP